FLSRVGDENTAGRLRLRLDTTDQDAVLQWTQFHLVVSSDRNLSERIWHCAIASANALNTWGSSPRIQRQTTDLFIFYSSITLLWRAFLILRPKIPAARPTAKIPPIKGKMTTNYQSSGAHRWRSGTRR